MTVMEAPSRGWGESKPKGSPAWKRDSKDAPWELQPGESRLDLLSLLVDIFASASAAVWELRVRLGS